MTDPDLNPNSFFLNMGKGHPISLFVSISSKKALQSNANRLLADITSCVVNKFEQGVGVGVGALCSEV